MKKLVIIVLGLYVYTTTIVAATVATAMRECTAECADNYMIGSREHEECEEQCDWDKARTKAAMRSATRRQ